MMIKLLQLPPVPLVEGFLRFKRRARRCGELTVIVLHGNSKISYGTPIETGFNMLLSCEVFRDAQLFPGNQQKMKSQLCGDDYEIDQNNDVILSESVKGHPYIEKHEFTICQVERQDVIPVKEVGINDTLSVGTVVQVNNDEVDISDIVATAFVANGWAEYVD